MVVLVGESGSGKSTVEKLAQGVGIKKVISVTTRPPRAGEVDGVDYHFIDYIEFLKLHGDNRLAEYVEYNGYYYGVRVEDCLDSTVVTVEPNGLRQLRARKDLDIKVIYMKATEERRAINMLNRGDTFDNVVDRVTKDREHFRGVEQLADYIIESRTEADLNKALSVIKGIMGGTK